MSSLDRYSKRILEHLADQRYRPRPAQELAEELGISIDELTDFQRSVERLVAEGQVVLAAANAVALPPPGREMTGSFRLNDRGFGFLVPDSPTEHGDLFVPQGNTGGAMTGDRVRAAVIHAGDRGAGKSPYIGRVKEILVRKERRFVGNLAKRGSQFLVEVDGRVLPQPVLIRDPHAKNAKIGDKVVVELLEYPRENAPANGVITEVLGEQGEPEVETLAVMHAYGLADKFPNEVLDEARVAAQMFNDSTVPPDREDLTNDFIVTIDPPDAKDYDDAISIRYLEPSPSGRGQGEGIAGRPGAASREVPSLELFSDFKPPSKTYAPPHPGPLPGGEGARWELGVHIADVSNFVRLGTELDGEAKKRGNSCYLPRKVVPMLPELLSNGVCSLQEGVNRYCKSAFIQFDEEGNVVGQRFANTVIRSAKRMTYMEAQALVDADIREARRHAKTEPKYSPKLVQTVQLMDRLAKIIRARRMSQGMIVLGLPEVELVFDDSGRVVDAQPEDTSFTHTMIEMFMVEANEAVARLFHNLRVPMIRRIHPDPDAHDITELRQFARVAGFNIPNRPSRKELQGLLEAVRGKPAQHAVHLAVLKTLSKAEYSPMTIGHFALASEHYTHFTSPIRRYPDLIVHRGLDAYFEAKERSEGRRAKGEGREGASSSSSPLASRASPLVASAMLSDPRCPDEEKLVELGRHCSDTERNAQSAEEALRTYLVLDLLSQQLGEDYEGTVTGVTGGGVFVELDRFLVDGFVRTTDLPGLPNDRWQFNRNTGALVAQRSGKTVTIGDRFTVRIATVNPVSRQMELVVVSDPAKQKKDYKEKRVQPPGARKAHAEAQAIKHQKKRERGAKGKDFSKFKKRKRR